MSYRRTRRRFARSQSTVADGKSMVAFLLVACFGILFAGCSGPGTDQPADEFAFTEQDVARFREIVMGEQEAGTGATSAPRLVGQENTATGSEPIVLDLSQVETYAAIRNRNLDEGNAYRVTNAFVNMRAEPSVTAELVEQLEQGQSMTVLEFPDAAWAKVRLPNGREGFVSVRYIAKLTSEEKLAEEKAKFDGQYFVNFGFLNVRKSTDADSEKLGELPGQAIVRPLSQDDVWARIPYGGKEGYVAVQYLQPFSPNFLVRQENYTLPILHYDMQREGLDSNLAEHIDALQSEGINILTLRDFADVLIAQEERDARVPPNSVVLAVSGITGANVKDVSDILRVSNVNATLFIQTNQVGLDGITEQMILTLNANGYDLQSAGHTGDDLRSLTNSQVELELQQSRQLLEEQSDQTVNAILYPLGGYNARVQEIAEASGYLFGIGSDPARTYTRRELLQLPSYTVLPEMTAEDVVTVALGTEQTEAEEE